MEIGALIVDDEEDIRTLIQLIIDAANRGLFVRGQAADGDEALEKIDEMNPEVVILDERMPGLSGVETARLMLRKRPGQQIVLCSAYLDTDLKRRAEEAGIRICMTKREIDRIPQVLQELANTV